MAHSERAMARMRQEIDRYAWAGQFQQQPTTRGETIFEREWWQLWDPSDGKFPERSLVIASLDGAFTEKEENDPSGLTVQGLFEHPVLKRPRIILIAAWRKRLRMHGIPTPRSKHEELKIGDTEHMKRAKDIQWMRRCGAHWGLVEWTAWTCRVHNVDKLPIEAKGPGCNHRVLFPG